jgi:hypothetical protein
MKYLISSYLNQTPHVKTLPTLLLCSALILTPSCSATRTGSGVRATNRASTLTAWECEKFGEEIVDAINQSGVISRYYKGNGSSPVVLALGDFLNDSGRIYQEVTRTISFSIFEALVNGTGGMVLVNTDIKGSGWNIGNPTQGSSQLLGTNEYDQTTTTKFGQAQAAALVLTAQFATIGYQEARTSRYDHVLNVILTDAQTSGIVFAKTIILPKWMTTGLHLD